VHLAVRTGNLKLDEEASARRETLVMPFFSQLKKLRQSTGGDSDETFNEVTTLSKLPGYYVVKSLAKHSDLQEEEIVRATAHDEDAKKQLMCLAMQMCSGQKLPEALIYKEIADKVVALRSRACSNSLAKFKASGGLKTNGAIDWRRGCYELVFTETDLLQSLKHFGGSTVQVKPELGIANFYHFESNWLDMQHQLVMKPLPPIKLCNLFTKTDADGPWCVPSVSGKRQYEEFARHCRGLHTEPVNAKQTKIE